MSDCADPGIGSPATIASAQEINQPVDIKTAGVYPFQVQCTNPYWAGYTPIAIADAVAGKKYALRFAMPNTAVTISYQAVSGDTKETIAQKLCDACKANGALYNPDTGLPILFWIVPGGGFNVQPSALLGDGFGVTSVGDGAITVPPLLKYLDFAVTILGRNVPGYKLRSGDSPHALQFMCNGVDGNYALIPALISVQVPDAINGHAVMYLTVLQDWMTQAQWGIAGSGTVLFGKNSSMPEKAYMGAGWFNAAGGIAINGVSVADEIDKLKKRIEQLEAAA